MSTTDRRILVIGLGSIGSRHLRNLKSLGCRYVAGVDPSEACRKKALQDGAEITFGGLEEGLDRFDPQILFICSPTSMHLQQALLGARQGLDLFVEKPACHTLEGVETLVREIPKGNGVTMSACNFRFHPGPVQLKKIVDTGTIGNVWGMRMTGGSFLPDWRPWQDCRQSYSGCHKLGGGVLMDWIHELDILRWFLGTPARVSAMAKQIGHLGIETEDLVEMSVEFLSGCIGSAHLDYLQRAPQRRYEVYGEQGTAIWDMREGKVDLFTTARGRWQSLPYDSNYDLNTMYLREIQHFLACVAQRKPTILPLESGAEAVRMALAAARSSAAGRTIELRSALEAA